MQYLLSSGSPSSLQAYKLHTQTHTVCKRGLLRAVKQQSQTSVKTSWPRVSLSLFGAGFVFGPLLDGLHSRVELVAYKSGAIDIGPLHTNIWVGFNFSMHSKKPYNYAFIRVLLDKLCGLNALLVAITMEERTLHILPCNIIIGCNFICLVQIDIDRFLPCWGCFTARLVCFNSTLTRGS